MLMEGNERVDMLTCGLISINDLIRNTEDY